MKRLLEQTLPFRKIVDMGMVEYREFACSRATFDWLRSGAMTHVDGEQVRLSIADECVAGNVIVKADPVGIRPQTSSAYAWQAVAA